MLRALYASTRSMMASRGAAMRMGAWGVGNSLLIPLYGIFAIVVVFRAAPEEELGAYLVLQAIYLMAVQLARSFGYTPLVRHYFEQDRRREIVGSSLLLTLIFHTIVLGALVAARTTVADLLACPQLPALIWYVAAAVVLGVPAELRMAIFQAEHRTRHVFLINASYHLAMIVAITATVAATGSAHARHLLHAAVAAAAVSSLTAVALPPRGFHRPTVRTAELRRMYAYGRFTLGTSLSEVVFTRLDVLILSAFRGPLEVAAYGVSKVFVRVFDIYLHTTALVVFPLFCRLWSEGRMARLWQTYRRLLRASCGLFVVLAAALALAAIPMVRFFYGGKYPTAGPLLIAFSLTGLTIPLMSLPQNLINAAGVPSFVFGSRVAVAALNLALDILLIRLWGAVGAVAAMITSYTILAIVLTRKASQVLPPHARTPRGGDSAHHSV